MLKSVFYEVNMLVIMFLAVLDMLNRMQFRQDRVHFTVITDILFVKRFILEIKIASGFKHLTLDAVFGELQLGRFLVLGLYCFPFELKNTWQSMTKTRHFFTYPAIAKESSRSSWEYFSKMKWGLLFFTAVILGSH